MRKVYLVVMMCCAAVLAMAQKGAPKWMEKQRKAVVTITTYGSDNKTLQTGTGFFITGTGEALSGYELFKGATRATVTDTDGKVYQVSSVLGADDLYDVIRFKVNVDKPVPFFPLASDPLSVGTKVYAIPYVAGKNGTFREGALTEVTNLKDPYSYYKTSVPLASDPLLNAPVVTENGMVVGLMQEDAGGNKDISYAVSAGYANSLNIASTDLLNSTYTQIGIRKAWPADIEQANVTLYLLAGTQDIQSYQETLNDFIATFPDSPDGYVSRATLYAYRRAELAASPSEQQSYLDKALADIDRASQFEKGKADAFYNKALIIYNVVTADTTVNNPDWNMKTAISALQNAIEVDDLPLYRQLEGDIYLTLGVYDLAYQSYMKVNESNMATPSSYYWAAKALEQIPGANIGDMIALLDKAIDNSSAIATEELLTYILERIDFKLKLMQFEEAVTDYNLYYDKLYGDVGDSFYYYRGQAKFRSGNVDGALADMQEALKLSPEDPNYLAEEASIYIRQENYAKALESTEKALAIVPDFASCYRLKGICLVRTGKKPQACDAFNKAKELGDPLANRLIREHCQ